MKRSLAGVVKLASSLGDALDGATATENAAFSEVREVEARRLKSIDAIFSPNIGFDEDDEDQSPEKAGGDDDSSLARVMSRSALVAGALLSPCTFSVEGDGHRRASGDASDERVWHCLSYVLTPSSMVLHDNGTTAPLQGPSSRSVVGEVLDASAFLLGSSSFATQAVAAHPNSRMKAYNFVSPASRRKGALVFPSHRELVEEHVSLSAGVGSGSGSAVAMSGIISACPGVDIPKGAMPSLLLRISADTILSEYVMRAFVAAVGETILCTDPSCPSGGGPMGLSLSQFREFGRCISQLLFEQGIVAVTQLRQTVVTSIFESCAKPFQFLSLSAFVMALSLVAVCVYGSEAIIGMDASMVSSFVASPTKGPSPTTTGRQNPAKVAERVVALLQRFAADVLSLYNFRELPVWADPEMDLFWMDHSCQRHILQYTRLIQAIFDIFAVAPEDEILSALRRSSSLGPRGSTAVERSGSSAAVPTPPQTSSKTVTRPQRSSMASQPAFSLDDVSAMDAEGGGAANGKKTTLRPHGVTFVGVSPRNRRTSAATSTNSADAPAAAAVVNIVDHVAKAQLDAAPGAVPASPQQRLREMGFSFVGPEDPSFFPRGCDQVKVLTLSSLQRIIATMALPNVTPSDVTRAAKASSCMFRRHPFRLKCDTTLPSSGNRNEEKREPAGRRSASGTMFAGGTAAHGAHSATSAAIVSAFGSGVNPLTKCVPHSDIFLLEQEFVDVVMRLSIVAFPDLVVSENVVVRAERRGDSHGARRSSLTSRYGAHPTTDDVADVLSAEPSVPNFNRRSSFSPPTAACSGPKSLKFSPALERVLQTYIEGFYLQSTGSSVAAKKSVMVGAADVMAIAAKDCHGMSRQGLVAPAVLHYIRTAYPTVESSDETDDFAPRSSDMLQEELLALPIVTEVIVESFTGHKDGDSFFLSDRRRDDIPGWNRTHHVLVPESGGLAVAHGHLMNDITGFYVMFEGRVAVRATRVLAALLPHGKKTSTPAEALSLATSAEFVVPPLEQLFGKSMMSRTNFFRAVRCVRDGTRVLRVHPFTLVKVRVQYSSDGSHWTRRPSTQGSGGQQTDTNLVSSRVAPDVHHMVMKLVRPATDVPLFLTEALRVVFQTYARHMEAVKEDVINIGKWRHFCQCLFFEAVDAQGGGPPSCSVTANRSSQSFRRGSVASRQSTSSWVASDSVTSGQSSPTSPNIVPAACGECLGCRVRAAIEWKLQQSPAAIDASWEGDTTTPASSRFVFHPRLHMPRVSLQDMNAAFQKHCEMRSVSWANGSNRDAASLRSNSGTEPLSYTVMNFEGFVSAIIDILINHNTLCRGEAFDHRTTEALLEPRHWWATLTGALYFEGLRRRSCHTSSYSRDDAAQMVVVESLHEIVGNMNVQLAFQSQWALGRSGIGFTSDAADETVLRTLVEHARDMQAQQVTTRRVLIFFGGVCVAELVENPAYQFWDCDCEPDVTVVRSQVLSVCVFASTSVSTFRRLLAVNLPFEATLQRLFKAKYLPLVVDRGSVVGRLNGKIAHPIACGARRFWFLRRRKTGDAVGCLSNLPGQCATPSWIPTPGCYESPLASMFLMEQTEGGVLSLEALTLFRLFLSVGIRNVSPNDRFLLDEQQKLREKLEQYGNLVLEPVFP